MFELPIEIVALITLIISFLVMQGAKSLLANFGWDLSGKVAMFTAILVGSIVFFIEGFVGMFPVDVQQVVVTVLQALIAVLGMFGVHKTVKGFGG